MNPKTPENHDNSTMKIILSCLQKVDDIFEGEDVSKQEVVVTFLTKISKVLIEINDSYKNLAGLVEDFILTEFEMWKLHPGIEVTVAKAIALSEMVFPAVEGMYDFVAFVNRFESNIKVLFGRSDKYDHVEFLRYKSNEYFVMAEDEIRLHEDDGDDSDEKKSRKLGNILKELASFRDRYID